jgi:hypothetical protein
MLQYKIRDSVIAIGYGSGNPSTATNRIFSFHVIKTGCGGTPSLLSNGYLGLFPQEQGGLFCEVDDSH